MSRHVADQHAGTIPVEAGQQKEIAANTFGGHQTSRRARLGAHDRRLGQQLELQVMRELHFPNELLPFNGGAHKRGVMHRRTDLGAHGEGQLAVTGAERLSSRPSTKHQHAKRNRRARLDHVSAPKGNLMCTGNAHASARASNGYRHERTAARGQHRIGLACRRSVYGDRAGAAVRGHRDMTEVIE